MRKFDGKALRRQRELRHKRLEEMAVEMGRSYAAIVSYETGRVDPPASVVAVLADNLGCDPGVFFTEVDDDVA